MTTKARVFTDNEIAQMIELYVEGKSIDNVAIQLRTHYTRVRDVLARNNVELRPRYVGRKKEAPAASFSNHSGVVLFDNEPPPGGMKPLESPHFPDNIRIYIRQ